MLEKDMIKNIRKYAIKNAMDYGKARTENVLGRVVRSAQRGAWVSLSPKLKGQ